MDRFRSLLLIEIGVVLGACAHVDRAAPDAKIERIFVTGSHIAQRVDVKSGLPATTAPVRIYYRASLDATGRPQLADALFQLDPGVVR